MYVCVWLSLSVSVSVSLCVYVCECVIPYRLDDVVVFVCIVVCFFGWLLVGVIAGMLIDCITHICAIGERLLLPDQALFGVLFPGIANFH